MSVHKSLQIKSRLTRSRNVLTRVERLTKLMEQERWEGDKDSVFNLPKVSTLKMKRRGKKKEKKKEDEA